jgi:hypothetical protein
LQQRAVEPTFGKSLDPGSERPSFVALFSIFQPALSRAGFWQIKVLYKVLRRKT